MCSDYQDIVFIVGNGQSYFTFNADNQLIELRYSLFHIHDKLKELDFIQINGYIIFNTKYFAAKDGNIHKVSRNSWKHFKTMPTEFLMAMSFAEVALVLNS